MYHQCSSAISQSKQYTAMLLLSSADCNARNTYASLIFHRVTYYSALPLVVKVRSCIFYRSCYFFSFACLRLSLFQSSIIFAPLLYWALLLRFDNSMMRQFIFTIFLAAASVFPFQFTPFLNNALWQEAIAFDAKDGNGSTENQSFYTSEQELQSQEYSSDVESASSASVVLQNFNSYPAEFDQPQAANPSTTLGMSD